jgi:hypothetical protein
VKLRGLLFKRSGIADGPSRPMELVTWQDAYDGPASWTKTRDVVHDPTLVSSVGFVLEPSPVKDHLVLVTNLLFDGEDEVVSGGIVIPRGLVVTRRRLG